MVHIEIPDDIIDRIDNAIEGKNVTDKVRNYINSDYLSKEFILAERERLLLKLKHIDKLLKENPFYSRSALTEPEKEFLKLAMDKIKKNPDYIYGQKEAYNKEFNKRYTLKEFELLLYKFKDEIIKASVKSDKPKQSQSQSQSQS